MNEINKYLNIIGSKLQLSKEKFEELNKNYKAISSYIANKHALSGDEEYSIYQQGSFAIDTAIKPLKGDEFDVDVVVEFDIKKVMLAQLNSIINYIKLLKKVGTAILLKSIETI